MTSKVELQKPRSPVSASRSGYSSRDSEDDDNEDDSDYKKQNDMIQQEMQQVMTSSQTAGDGHNTNTNTNTTSLKFASPKQKALLQKQMQKKHNGRQRQSTAKLIQNADIKRGKKYERYLTIPDSEIASKDEMIYAIILQSKLPHFYKLAEDDQFDALREKYPWVEEELDQFELEETMEVVEHMTTIDKMPLYDTMEQYNEENEELRERHRMAECEVKGMYRWKRMYNDDKHYVCSGCGIRFDYESKKQFKKYSKRLRGYVCRHTQREYIFHSRLCVKFRKAKQFLREAIYKYELKQRSSDHVRKPTRISIDFLKDEELDDFCKPSEFWTTFDESHLRVAYVQNIRKYRQQVINTDFRGYDIDEGDLFKDIPLAIKHLDMREYAIPMFEFLLRQVDVKYFELFWQLIKFFAQYIPTPTLIQMVKDGNDVIFPLHYEGDPHLSEFLTVVCSGALYPIATCLSIAAHLEEEGSMYWSEEETDVLFKHFWKMAHTLIENIESKHLIAIILETPTNIENGASVIEIAIKYKLLEFLQNAKIAAIATTLWYERKIIHPRIRFGDSLAYIDIFRILTKKPARFFFSPYGQNVLNFSLYVMHYLLFLYVTYNQRYNYEAHKDDSEFVLAAFNLGEVFFVVYNLATQPREYLKKIANLNACGIAVGWVFLFLLRFVYPSRPVLDAEGAIDHVQTRSTKSWVQAYMLVWGIQCFVFNYRVVVQFQRWRKVGPLLQMIKVMLEDVINFLILVAIFWLGITFAMYYILAADLEDMGFTSFQSVALFSMKCILGQQSWTDTASSETFAPLRSRMIDFFISLTAIVGNTLLLNLLIAMLSSTYSDQRELTELEVNYIRIKQSYDASAVSAFIGPPFNYIALMLMSVWVLLDFIITNICCARRNMLNDWYFTPLNRQVFCSGDYIEYVEYTGPGYTSLVDTDGDGKPGTGAIAEEAVSSASSPRRKRERDASVASATAKAARAADVQLHIPDLKPKEIRKLKANDPNWSRSGSYVKYQLHSEMAVVEVAGQPKFIKKKHIIAIEKHVITEVLKNSDAKAGCCATLINSGRYYCKYCRYYLLGEQVGSAPEIERLFLSYGKKLDWHNVERLRNMLGRSIDAGSSERFRKYGCPQLCPECYRPFFCSDDHADEVWRLQFLTEVCSFWVFMASLWIPLIILFSIPGFCSWALKLLQKGRSKLQSKQAAGTKDEQLRRAEAKQIKMVEHNDEYRARVRQHCEQELDLKERVEKVIAGCSRVHVKISKTENDDEEHNMVTQFREKIELRKLELTPEESKLKMIMLKQLYFDWLIKLEAIMKRIQGGRKEKVFRPGAKRRQRDRFY